MAWRLIDLGSMDPALTAAADEAVLTCRSKGTGENTLAFYSRDGPTVSLGYFESAEEGIDLDLCREKGIGIVRRLSGGSAVFTDPGQIVYSVTLEAGIVPTNPKDSYPLICGGVVTALRSLGIVAEHKPLNDVVVHGRKISGSAQTRKAGFVLQHGTVIVDSDLDLMMRVIRQRPGKPRDRDGMTSVSLELGRNAGLDEVKHALAAGFGTAFGATMRRDEMTAEEKLLMIKLSEEKYRKRVFTFQR
jgi:lipoate-protein ligase A